MQSNKHNNFHEASVPASYGIKRESGWMWIIKQFYL